MACGILHTPSWYYNHVIQNENSFVDHPLLVPLLLTFSYASGSLGSILRLDFCAKAGLHAKQERRKAAIDASVEMSAVSAVPDSMEDRNELRRVDIWAVCEKSPKMKWQVFSFFALNCESSKSGVPFGSWGLQWTWFWARCQWIGCSNSGGEKMQLLHFVWPTSIDISPRQSWKVMMRLWNASVRNKQDEMLAANTPERRESAASGPEIRGESQDNSSNEM